MDIKINQKYECTHLFGNIDIWLYQCSILHLEKHIIVYSGIKEAHSWVRVLLLMQVQCSSGDSCRVAHDAPRVMANFNSKAK